MKTTGQSIVINSELLDLRVGTIIIDPGGMSARIGYELGVGRTVVTQDVNGHPSMTFLLKADDSNRPSEYMPLPLDIEHPEGEMVIIWTP